MRIRRNDSVSKINSRCGATHALFNKEHIMTPSELDQWDTDAPVWTPYRAPQH
jgi:hypothetical protein